ncbi:IclR family transcriptional regulator [Amycolatopsis thermalba]|uniref:IclR family transcriptional regulator n=2 Tax=Pseudonocardiaceae TaxID=2070 RepID=A0ABY4P6X1_9PSEU|nr:IclR family transcriptional regulator [Amycolatopsis sp. KNN50.9b]UQS28034.1 IclR family transcriptional regulator [Amycolatopsis thermalba]
MVGKALRVLSLLGEYPDGAGVSELARRAGYPVSTTHRLLSSLQEQGFARSDPGSKRYALGLRLFELGQRVSHARGFAGVALPVLRALTEQTGEPTLMAVLDGHEQVYVHSVQGPRQIQIRGEPGLRGPLHCTAMGKCLVAFAPAPVREELVGSLELAELAPRTITSREEFAREIRSVRSRGYAMADEEHEPGIRAVGVPILGPDGVAMAALSTAAPAYRISVAELEAFVPALQEAARELGAVLPR